MGVYLASNYESKEFNVVAFGSPKIGNAAFKVWSESLPNLSVWRVVYRADIVPRFLASAGYKHAGHLFQIWRRKSELFYNHDGGGEYKSLPTSWKCKHKYFSITIIWFQYSTPHT